MLTIFLTIALLLAQLLIGHTYLIQKRLVVHHHQHATSSHLKKNDCNTANRLLYVSDPSTSISGSPPLENNSYNFDIFKYFILFIVPCIWGSYTPLVKGLFTPTIVSIAPPIILFNLLSYLVSFTTLSLVRADDNVTITQVETSLSDEIKTSNTMKVRNLDDSTNANGTSLETIAGIELGLYLFMGSSMQVIGIQGTSVLHASILVQLTTVIVPLLDKFLSRRNMSSSLYFSCAMGLLGVIYIATDNGDRVGNSLNIFDVLRSLSPSSLNTADLFVCASAIFYSLHIVRLNSVAKKVSPIKLGRVKSLTELIASFIITISFLIGSSALTENGTNSNEIIAYFHNIINSGNLFTYGNLYVIFAILWNGVFATALTIWAQTIGQKYVNATTANLIYSSQPIFAALFSFAFFGNTNFSTSFVIGTVFLLTSILSAIVLQNEE